VSFTVCITTLVTGSQILLVHISELTNSQDTDTPFVDPLMGKNKLIISECCLFEGKIDDQRNGSPVAA
jgi:hypothetical protein